MKLSITLALATAFCSAINLVGAAPASNTTEEEIQELFSRQSLATVYTTCSTPNTIALTFDDGPYTYTDTILNHLEAAGAKGTFFFNGNNWGCIYSSANVQRVKNVYNRGHQVASHTWSHANLATLSSARINEEFQRVEQALQRIVGVQPAFMRPPYGSYNNLVRQVAAARGQSIVMWSFDSGDSSGASVATQRANYDALANQRPSTAIALNHETYASTANDVLPYALQVLSGKGYRFVTVAECLGRNPYQRVTSPQSGSWSC